mmetsp:Transcript_44892/g.105324  ORF Transcript_44892/g.105324 Transcript_44892/m.105324 type:complete len:769 (+) Transcript_44892:104-2410(+)
MIQDGWWDLWIFIAYISIPLEITMVAFRLHGQIFVGKLTMVKVVLVCVAVLFVAFIVACGITHFLSFLHMVECESSIGPTLEYCATMTTTGPMSSTISVAKAVTAIVSVLTAVVLGLVMPQLLQFLLLFSLFDTHVQNVEDTLRVMLSSTDVYSTHECPSMGFRSISESGRWLLEHASISIPNVKRSTLYDLIAEVDRARVKREVETLISSSIATSFERQPRSETTRETREGSAESSAPLLEDVEAGYNSFGRVKECQRIEYRVKAAEGVFRWVESCFVHDAQCNVVHVVTRDIEARKDEERRREKELSIQNAQDTVQRWLHYMSCVAHDLKTPLTCFEMAIEEIAQDEGMSPDSLEALGHARAATGVLRGTVGQAICVRSSVSSGIKPTPRLTETSMQRLFATIGEMVPALSISKTVQIKFEIQPGVPPKILSDEGWLMQMALNLVSNSCKYTTKGSVTARALAKSQIDNGETQRVLRVEVQDTGMGMRPESTTRLFEPFYVAQQGQGDGTGLGLYSVRLHAETLGGRCGYLPVPPEQGTGSIFFFEVPLIEVSQGIEGASSIESNGNNTPASSIRAVRVRDDNSSCGDQNSPAGDTSSPLAAVKKRIANGTGNGTKEKEKKEPIPEVLQFREKVKKVLVVDDVDSIRKLLSARLKRIAPGIAIDTSEHGLEGYNKWQAAAENGEGYDLIITDVVMPLMSGPEMVARIRESERNSTHLGRVSICGMSANSAAPEVQDFIDTGMNTFMTKPMPSSSKELCEGLLAALA